MATTTELATALDRAESALSRARDRARAAAEETVEQLAVVAGGALGGYLDAEFGAQKIIGLSYPLALGGLLSVAGMFGWAGRQSNMVQAVGGGLLAWEGGKAVYKVRTQQQQAAPPKVQGNAVGQLFGAPQGDLTAEELQRQYIAYQAANRQAA
jgi:hypothetical protein